MILHFHANCMLKYYIYIYIRGGRCAQHNKGRDRGMFGHGHLWRMKPIMDQKQTVGGILIDGLARLYIQIVSIHRLNSNFYYVTCVECGWVVRVIVKVVDWTIICGRTWKKWTPIIFCWWMTKKKENLWWCDKTKKIHIIW